MDIILVGRGPSIKTFDWPADVPIACVSSAIFLRCLPRKPAFFLTIDAARYFCGGAKRWRWQDDENTGWWDMCRDCEVAKHITHSGTRADPLADIICASPIDNVPDDRVPNPAWSEFPNVTAWGYDRWLPFNIDGPGPIGGGQIAHSLIFAIQVLARLGFRDVGFAGVDMKTDWLVKAAEALNALRGQSTRIKWPMIPIQGERDNGNRFGKVGEDHVQLGVCGKLPQLASELGRRGT